MFPSIYFSFCLLFSPRLGRCDPVMVDSGDEDELSETAPTPSAGLHATLQLRQYRVTLLGDVFSREVQLSKCRHVLRQPILCTGLYFYAPIINCLQEADE